MHGIAKLGEVPRCLACMGPSSQAAYGYYLDRNNNCVANDANNKGCMRRYNGNGNGCVQCDYFNGFYEYDVQNGYKICKLFSAQPAATTSTTTTQTNTYYQEPVDDKNYCDNPGQTCTSCISSGLYQGCTSCAYSTLIQANVADSKVPSNLMKCSGQSAIRGCMIETVNANGALCLWCNAGYSISSDQKTCTQFSSTVAGFEGCLYGQTTTSSGTVCMSCMTGYKFTTSGCLSSAVADVSVSYDPKICISHGYYNGKYACLVCNPGYMKTTNGGCIRQTVTGCMVVNSSKQCLTCDYFAGYYEIFADSNGFKTCRKTGSSLFRSSRIVGGILIAIGMALGLSL